MPIQNPNLINVNTIAPGLRSVSAVAIGAARTSTPYLAGPAPAAAAAFAPNRYRAKEVGGARGSVSIAGERLSNE